MKCRRTGIPKNEFGAENVVVARVLNLKTYELELRKQSRGGIGEVGESIVESEIGRFERIADTGSIDERKNSRRRISVNRLCF
ncbi:hypothetical protein SASPL_124390 [Salvia splendens]|uniref:Uncharacterized protein n=1 Tax=Salvia splendens TaxID=180675 RepID=A0A8X8XQV1_SALSN|nr:hypothetical protein SASPL_124390 [Salvia splendens]